MERKTVLMELIGSSSSSSSSDEEKLLDSVVNTYLEKVEDLLSSSDDEFLNQIHPSTRTIRHRIVNFVADVADAYGEEEFRSHFRISRSTSVIIAEFEMSAHLLENSNLSPKTQIYAFLWFAGNKTMYREVANLFNVGTATVYKIVKRVTDFFYEQSKKYINFPVTEQDKNTLSAKFEKIAGFPNVIGCIDGSYIQIRTPANKMKNSYVNQHDGTSLTLQGICDNDRKFLDVSVGCPSRMHDARVFEWSPSPIAQEIGGICAGQFHLLGDGAYPLRKYLLTSFKDCGNLSTKQRKYNKKLSQTRVKIENCFGLLKQRFRQLKRRLALPLLLLTSPSSYRSAFAS